MCKLVQTADESATAVFLFCTWPYMLCHTLEILKFAASFLSFLFFFFFGKWCYMPGFLAFCCVHTFMCHRGCYTHAHKQLAPFWFVCLVSIGVGRFVPM